MAHDICGICKEKKATPSHVNAAHGMKFDEYLIKGGGALGKRL